MKPLDTAVRPAPELSIRPQTGPATGTQAPPSDTERRGELMTAGSLDGLDGSTRPEPAMPRFLEREEVNAVIRKLRQGYSIWKRIQSITIDEQRLDEARDGLLPYRQLIR